MSFFSCHLSRAVTILDTAHNPNCTNYVPTYYVFVQKVLTTKYYLLREYLVLLQNPHFYEDKWYMYIRYTFGAYTFAGIWVLGFGSWVLQFGSWVLGSGSNKTRSIKIRLDIVKTHMPRPIWLDPGPNKCSKGWQIILDPFARTQMLGPKCLDVNTVTNVHVWTKLTIGTSEHSFKSVDEGR